MELKEYAVALEYFQSTRGMNGTAIGGPGMVEFNAGMCCRELGKQEEAREWFGKSSNLGYKPAEKAKSE